jgi:hypothetical protein
MANTITAKTTRRAEIAAFFEEVKSLAQTNQLRPARPADLLARRGLAGDEPREMGIPHLKRLALLALVASAIT